MKTDLLTVPGIGKNIKQDLIDIGIDCVEALRGQDPELLYQKDCEHKAASRTAASSTSCAAPSTMPTRPPRARPPTRRNAGGGTGRSTFILLRTTPNRFSPLLKFARTPLFGGWLCPSDPELLLYSERDFAPLRSPERALREFMRGW